MPITQLVTGAALASAGALHLIAAGSHARYGAAHTAAFVAVALLQALGAIVVLTGARSRMLAIVAVSNVVVVGAWVMSRTIGLPVLAPNAEPAGIIDSVAGAAGIVAIAGLIVLVRGDRMPRFVARRAVVPAMVVLATFTLASGVGSAVEPGGGHHGAYATHANSTHAHATHAHATHGPIARAIAQRLGDTVHIHGLGGPDLDPGQVAAAPARARAIPTGALPSAVIAAGDRIWVANRSDGTLSRIDPQTLEPQRIDVGGAPAALAQGFGAIWVADFGRDVVLRIDPATGALLGSIAVEPGPAALAVTDEGVWVSAIQEGTVQLIDPVGDRAGPPISVGYGPIALATSGDAVWVLNTLDREVVLVQRGRVSRRVAVPAGAADIVVAFDRLWVASSSAGVVAAFDPRTGSPAARPIVVDDRTDAGQGPTGLAAGNGRLWVANNHDKTVRSIDPTTRAISAPKTFDRRLGTGPIAVRATHAFGALWVTDFDAGSLVRIEEDR